MAWLDAWLALRRIDLHRRQSALLAQAEAAALATAREGMDGATGVLQWQAMRAMHELQHVREQQRLDEALADLHARIGERIEATQLAAALPSWPQPDVAALREGLARLPDLARLDAEAREAESERAMRAAEARPQWTWMLGYGERMPGMSEMASLEVRVSFDGLFGRRQSQREAAATARREAVMWRHADRLRALEGEIDRALATLSNAQAALAVVDTRLLPLRERQHDLAQARYAQGAGELMAVFEARSALLDVELERWMSLESLWRARLRLLRLDAAPSMEPQP